MPLSRRWGFAAAGWAALHTALHLYWALGGAVVVVHLLLETDARYDDGAISAAQRTWAL
ncbi:MAG: hypothetical protein ACLGI3_07680 [Actinomycetes bacterium]